MTDHSRPRVVFLCGGLPADTSHLETMARDVELTVSQAGCRRACSQTRLHRPCLRSRNSHTRRPIRTGASPLRIPRSGAGTRPQAAGRRARDLRAVGLLSRPGGPVGAGQSIGQTCASRLRYGLASRRPYEAAGPPCAAVVYSACCRRVVAIPVYYPYRGVRAPPQAACLYSGRSGNSRQGPPQWNQKQGPNRFAGKAPGEAMSYVMYSVACRVSGVPR